MQITVPRRNHASIWWSTIIRTIPLHRLVNRHILRVLLRSLNPPIAHFCFPKFSQLFEDVAIIRLSYHRIHHITPIIASFLILSSIWKHLTSTIYSRFTIRKKKTATCVYESNLHISNSRRNRDHAHSIDTYHWNTSTKSRRENNAARKTMERNCDWNFESHRISTPLRISGCTRMSRLDNVTTSSVSGSSHCTKHG